MCHNQATEMKKSFFCHDSGTGLALWVSRCIYVICCGPRYLWILCTVTSVAVVGLTPIA